jgi:predicted RNase H-like HicB family nuclease
MTLALSPETIDKIGPLDWAALERLHDEGWCVEEIGLTTFRVVAEWEDLGVFVAREFGPAPWNWSAWLGDEESCYSTGNTLAEVLAGLAAEMQSTAAQIAKFAKVTL